ncbi:MAG: response regulator [Blastocatellia bacterium]
MGSRILLADDSITIQKVVNLTFADEGIEVVAVSNGDTAQRRLAEVNPDLVLADIFMPGKNGYELCEFIKKSAQFSKVPVVLLIGAFEPFNEAEARRVHADAHLTKPFESRTLVETVRKLINVSGHPRTGPIAQAPAPEVKKEEPRQSFTTKNMEALGPEDFAQATVAQPSAMSLEALNDAAPLDFDYTPADDSVSVTTDAQSTPGDHSFNSSSGWSRRTDDLSFSTDPAPFQSFGLNDLNVEASDLSAPISVAVEDHPPNFSLNSQVMETPVSFNEAEQVELDYSKSDNRADYEIIGFDVDASDPFDVDASGLQDEGDGQAQTAQPQSFDTQRLDMSLNISTGDTAVDTNPLEMPVSASDDSFSFGEQAGDSADPASLLAVDEPLGDVLMDETVREGFPSANSEQPLDQSLTGEAFGIDLIPQASMPDAQSETPATVSSDVAFTMIESENAHDQATPIELSNEFTGVDSVEVVSASVEETPQTELKSEPVSEFNYESAEQANPVASQSVAEHNGQESTVHDTDFASYSTWPSEETESAPIDIEATTVEESAAADVKDEVSEPERGFEFTPARSEASQTSPEPVEFVAPVSEEPQAQTASVAPDTVEISPALIDEIVRRVVARMSDSVVREIAWDVVPDCVERVIKDMTRQELSKR